MSSSPSPPPRKYLAKRVRQALWGMRHYCSFCGVPDTENHAHKYSLIRREEAPLRISRANGAGRTLRLDVARSGSLFLAGYTTTHPTLRVRL